MNKVNLKSINTMARYLSIAALYIIILLGASTIANATEADAKKILKAMSNYTAAQKALSFEFDATLEVITQDDQKLALTSSGIVRMNRPDKVHATRSGGFADIEMSFDGKALTLLGKNHNLYTQIEIPGSIDNLIEVLKDKYNRPLPAADLLLSNPYDALMDEVIDVKDLGSGVVGGIECDYLAFRTNEVDWQIWVAQGEKPFPYKYVITSKNIKGSPQYTVQLRNWKTGNKGAISDFGFKNPSNATKVELEDLKGTGLLPDHFRKGETK